MNVLVISATCSKKKYAQIYKMRNKPLLDSSQKFFNSLITGMAKDNTLRVLSSIPVSHSCCKKLLFKKDFDNDKNVNYEYVGFINLPIIKQIITCLGILIRILKWKKTANKENSIIICDPLVLEGSLALMLSRVAFRKIGVLTDLPMMSTFDEMNSIKKTLYNIYNRLCDKNLMSLDGFVFLTKEMNVINKNNKPYMIMECIINPEDVPDLIVNESSENKILYAGKLHKEFGMELLVNSIQYINSDCEIHIFGEGNYYSEIERCAKEYKNVHLHGVVTYDEIIKEEMSSSILINPRTSSGEFTKYSFPSKTVEYLASGVPVVMFRLAGIPDEYSDYIFFADSETPEDFAAAINKVMDLDRETRMNIGHNGRNFVLYNKNCFVQGERVLQFAKTITIK